MSNRAGQAGQERRGIQAGAWEVFNEFRANTEAVDGLATGLLLVPGPTRPSQAVAIFPASGSGLTTRQLVHLQGYATTGSLPPCPLQSTSASQVWVTPTSPRDVSWVLAPMGSGTPGDVRTEALESRPQASSFGGAAPLPLPRAYLGGPGCPESPGT